MSKATQIVDRLARRVQARNRELAMDAALKAALGFAFSAITFGILFWFGWVLGFMFGRLLHLDPWQFGVIFSGVFCVAAVWSAWQRVNPLADLEPPSDRFQMLRIIAHAAGSVYFSPRYATAGAALVLIGGPASLIETLGIWAHRIRVDTPLVESAARLLERCEPPLPVEELNDLHAAFLLKRLALLKLVPREESHALALTDKGHALLPRQVKEPRAK